MFSSKNPHSEEEWVAKKSVKKMDTLITGMILWGIIASIYGVKKITEKLDHQDTAHMLPKNIEYTERSEASVEKRGIFSRIFFGNK